MQSDPADCRQTPWQCIRYSIVAARQNRYIVPGERQRPEITRFFLIIHIAIPPCARPIVAGGLQHLGPLESANLRPGSFHRRHAFGVRVYANILDGRTQRLLDLNPHFSPGFRNQVRLQWFWVRAWTERRSRGYVLRENACPGPLSHVLVLRGTGTSVCNGALQA